MDLVSASREARSQHKQRAAWASIVVNLVLIVAKGAVLLVTGSVALLASTADSVLDLTASVFALLGVRATGLPPDDEHAYGHEKFENLSSLVQLMLLVVTTGALAAEGMRRLVDGGTTPHTHWYVFAVIIGATVLDVFVGRVLRRASHDVGGSAALDADALHFAGDILGNLAVLAGLGVVAAFGWRWADPVAALLVAAFIVRTAWTLGVSTLNALVDRAPAPEILTAVRRTLEAFPSVEHVHTLRAREAAGRVFLDVCVELDAGMSFGEAHDLTHLMQDALRDAVPTIEDAVIHPEPSGHPEEQDHEHHHVAPPVEAEVP